MIYWYSNGHKDGFYYRDEYIALEVYGVTELFNAAQNVNDPTCMYNISPSEDTIHYI